MFKFFKYSNFKVSIDLNPFVWGFRWLYQGPTASDPHLRIQYCRILFLSLMVVIDNGVYHTWEEEIVPTETKADVL
jgi:hypothetical protein